MQVEVIIESIQLAVAQYFSMSLQELKGHSSKRAVAVPRQIAMYLAKQLTDASLPDIGRQFGGKHHTTVMHSIATVDERRRTDPAMDRAVQTLQERLGSREEDRGKPDETRRNPEDRGHDES